MHALVDGDILRYEAGYASETGWQSEGFPSWDYTETVLADRIQRILNGSGAESYTLFITEGATFREALAVSKPYKGTRVDKKPWHFNNLTVHMTHDLGAVIVRDIEADDAMAIEQCRGAYYKQLKQREVAGHENNDETIICTRDKDLRQVPGWHYGWEMFNQPEFGPIYVDDARTDLTLNEKRTQASGVGLSFFYCQLITGDRVDNIPGLPGHGAVAAVNALNGTADQLDTVIDMYKENVDDWETYLLEQGRLLWMTRRLNDDGTPVLWEIGMTE